MKENKYICQSEIIAKYNFTKKIIADYLGTPDKLAINPHYHSGPKEKLWLISKVNEISKIPEVNSKTSKIAERRKKKEEIRNRRGISKMSRLSIGMTGGNFGKTDRKEGLAGWRSPRIFWMSSSPAATSWTW